MLKELPNNAREKTKNLFLQLQDNRQFKRLRTMSNYQIIGNKFPLREIIKGNL